MAQESRGQDNRTAADELPPPPDVSPPSGFKLKCHRGGPSRDTDDVSSWGGYWTRSLTTSRVVFGSGYGGVSVDIYCRRDLGVCPRHAMVTFEGEETGCVLASFGGQCMIGSRRACPPFALDLDHAQEDVGDPQVLVTSGKSWRPTRERPCFWFPCSRFTFMVEWPDDEGQSLAPPPGLPGPRRGGRGGGGSEGRKGARRSRDGGDKAENKEKSGDGPQVKLPRRRRRGGQAARKVAAARHSPRPSERWRLPQREPRWSDRPVMGGNSTHGDKTPRGAGYIALWKHPHYEPLYVCLVTKQSGIETFPGGPRDEDSEETVREAALRHWRSGVGLAPSRQETIPNVHVDDRKYGCRYLIADCGEPEAGTQQPDSRQWSWPPPTFQRDRNPVTNVRWVSVGRVLEKSTLLSPVRVGLLEEALGHRKTARSRARGLDAGREAKAQRKARGEPLVPRSRAPNARQQRRKKGPQYRGHREARLVGSLIFVRGAPPPLQARVWTGEGKAKRANKRGFLNLASGMPRETPRTRTKEAPPPAGRNTSPTAQAREARGWRSDCWSQTP